MNYSTKLMSIITLKANMCYDVSYYISFYDNILYLNTKKTKINNKIRGITDSSNKQEEK